MTNPPRLPDTSLALIFDMDGVIVDSNPMHRVAWEAFNRRYGLETTEAMHESMYGKRNDDIVRNFFGNLPDEEIVARGTAKEQLYREMCAGRMEEMLVPGIREFLSEYVDRPMGLASNGEPLNVRFILESAGIRSYFRAVVDGHQVRNPKPDPEIYLRVAELLGVAPGQCVVFEDSPAGVAAAVAAQMRVVGLRTTYDYLRGTSITVDNFLSGDLRRWLASQRTTSS